MAAEALEQSVLESKDKDQLLAIAKALGVKASSRTKKSDIIDQILESTGGSAPAVAAVVVDAVPTNGSATPPVTRQRQQRGRRRATAARAGALRRATGRVGAVGERRRHRHDE